jgi:ribonuclease HII
MIEIFKSYPRISFEKNKGYGTKEHREAICKYGLSRYSQKIF